VLLVTELMPKDKLRKDFEEDFTIRNNMAFADLMMICKEDVYFNLVETSRTEELPDGDARLAWEELKTIYKSFNTMPLIEVNKEFVLCELTDSSQDSNIWIRNLERD
jgi:hypothetical protein